MEREELARALVRAFDADPAVARVVARQATDLADSGQLERDLDVALSVDTVCSNLEDAPDEYSLRERWNWWVGSLSVTHDGYDRFAVRRLD